MRTPEEARAANAAAQGRYRKRHSERVKANRRARMPRERAYTRSRRSDPRTWPLVQMPLLRSRAKAMGRACTITADDIVVPERCPVFGVKFKFGEKNDCSPSVDRLDSARGYVPGNVHVISVRASLLKNNATLDELRQLVSYMETHQ